MNLKTGVTKKLPYWDCILEQIGLPFSEIEWKTNFLQEYAVIIVNSVLTEEEIRSVLNYVESGGSLLIEADFVRGVLKTKKVYIKYLFSREKIFGYHFPLIDLYRNCTVTTKANVFNNQEGVPVVSSFMLGLGNIIVIPDNFLSAIFDTRVLRKNFYSSIKKLPSERVSKVSKGSIYHFIRAALERLYHLRDLPFISLWNFPGSSKNIFAFRIDTDFSSKDQVNLLYKTLRDNNIKGTWFVETQSAEDWIGMYSSFNDQEIGVHCYRHRVFKSYKKNYNNFKTGIEVLNKASIFPKGIASPFGEWNESFSKAAEDIGFEYTSEFSYTYDNLPHFSNYENGLKNIIQVPVHPISFGRLFQAGYNDNEMYNYFVDVINNKIALCEPVIVYTHPQEKRYEILKRIFNFVDEMNLSKYTFNEYSTWWKERSKIKYSASFINNELRTETETKD
ncbi:MAG: polysaccharide deacetylase family protein, partial [Ignavibacteria bacterium]|nr:polysaccharide deacetylase family protein [Ignavibacteria bacterium]